jgi:hypothetical protein
MDKGFIDNYIASIHGEIKPEEVNIIPFYKGFGNSFG